ncbi:TraR/DksA C4-type zinc finger protein [Sneathiella sp.]|uniref:TraR/DksA C4-type zinc finger protein n=1 Tax=Sneathiella sp. TaxID=1964365 RepID=UPI002FDFB9A3
MADAVDHAQELSELQLRLAITGRRRQISAEARDVCDCGRDIPAARRAAVPNVQRCVFCQEKIERDFA